MTTAFTIGVDFGTNSVRAVVIDCRDGRAIGTHILNTRRAIRASCWTRAIRTSRARIRPTTSKACANRSRARSRRPKRRRTDGFFARPGDRHRRRHHRLDAAPGRCVESAAGARSEVEIEPRGARLALEGSHLGRRSGRDHRDGAPSTRRSCSRRSAGRIPPSGSGRRSGAACASRPTCSTRRRAGSSWPTSCRRCSPASSNPRDIVRGICAAGHKALYGDAWGGLPPKAFLATTRSEAGRPARSALRARLRRGYAGRQALGAWAETFGLPKGIAIAIGEFDAHYGAIGSGVTTGTFVKIIGTSTCDCVVSPMEKKLPDIPGICGIVPGSILPGYYGLEAGQSAVGDLLKWWVDASCDGQDVLHIALTEEASRLAAG